MGCGALCGDTTTADSIANHHSRQALGILIAQLQHNKQLINTHEYSSFFKNYDRQPRLFQLRNKPKLIKDEEISLSLLLKWKLLLLGLDKDDKTYCECVSFKTNACQNDSNKDKDSDSILFHDCFIQIEKDITRTFDVETSQVKKRAFQNVLKRVANHFPKMGYTQGINFIIKYLIIIGYSQMDSYEMFVHLAANKRYLLLGLYEDGFPLYNIFIVIFQNLLKRINQRLYQHLYEDLCIDPSMWICKWFMTFYVYSFPVELIKHILDLVILVGNLGIITFAIGLVQQLQPIILQISELSDLDTFLSSLRNIQAFNHHVNLQKLLAKAYSIQLVISDFDKIEQINCFYGVIIKSQFKIKNKMVTSEGYQVDLNQENEKMLQTWRKSLILDRATFVANHNRSTNQSNLQLEIESISKSLMNKDNIQNLQEIPQSITQLPQPPFQKINDNSFQTEDKITQPQPKMQYSINQIHEKAEEQDQSTKSKYIRQSKKSNTVDLDELDKLDFVEKIKRPINYSNSLRNSSIKPQRQQIFQPKTNSYNINQSNSLSIAGMTSLKKDESFDNVSVLSKQPSNKSNSKNINFLKLPKKNSRICGCKTKTEQNKLSNISPNNERQQQNKDQFSDKDSTSNKNFSHSQQNIDEVQSIQGVDTHRQRIQTHNNFMINSHGPAIKEDKDNHTAEGKPEADIEVMVLQFKKNKKARVNLIFPSQKVPKDKAINSGWGHEQQSIQSINQIQRSSQVHSNCSQVGNQYQIQSIR